jgi:hypothetical protein
MPITTNVTTVAYDIPIWAVGRGNVGSWKYPCYVNKHVGDVWWVNPHKEEVYCQVSIPVASSFY